jgi:myo-inositol-1(or 4)-monophosphatase
MALLDLAPYLDFAAGLAYRAGRLTLGYYQTDLRPDFKADDTPVTAADRAAEQFIRAEIESHYPGHAILGEEFGASIPGSGPIRGSLTGSSESVPVRESAAGSSASVPIRDTVKETVSSFCWIIDPIDGTKSFMRGVPLYAVLIGLEVEGVVRVGAAYYPALDEMLSAADGLGCWWNGRRARVSETADLERAFVCYTNVRNMAKHGREAAWKRIVEAAYACRGWSDAYGYLLVASGRSEAMLDPVMKTWDCGPFPPIFREAGGYFGDWRGNPGHTHGEALACNAALLPEILRTIGAGED